MNLANSDWATNVRNEFSTFSKSNPASSTCAEPRALSDDRLRLYSAYLRDIPVRFAIFSTAAASMNLREDIHTGLQQGDMNKVMNILFGMLSRLLEATC